MPNGKTLAERCQILSMPNGRTSAEGHCFYIYIYIYIYWWLVYKYQVLYKANKGMKIKLIFWFIPLHLFLFLFSFILFFLSTLCHFVLSTLFLVSEPSIQVYIQHLVFLYKHFHQCFLSTPLLLLSKCLIWCL